MDIQQIVNHIADLSLALKGGSLNGEQNRYVRKIHERTEDFTEIYTGMANGFVRRGDLEKLQELATLMLGHAELLNFQLIGELNDEQVEVVQLLCEDGVLLQQALTETFPELAE